MNNTTTHVGRRTLSGLTALGTNQATAFPLLNLANHEFTTVGSSTGAVLPTAKLADSVTVWNGGAHTLSVYPPLGGTVSGGSANAAVSLPTATGITFFASDLLTWYADSAPGSGASGTVNSGTSGQVAYYATTGAAVSGEGLSALIDSAIGSTQGDILYRGASAWSVLAPGSSGNLLQSGGAAANPSWVAATGTGTVTTVSVASANGFAGACQPDDHAGDHAHDLRHRNLGRQRHRDRGGGRPRIGTLGQLNFTPIAARDLRLPAICRSTRRRSTWLITAAPPPAPTACRPIVAD